MTTSTVFSINATNFIYGTSATKTIRINGIGEPQKVSFLNSSSHPNENGVYVIFSPEITDFSTKGEGCIYVGEGNIKQRLYSHKRINRFGKAKIDYTVVYYKVENQVDRRTIERILIKYHDPTHNKEGVSKLDLIKRQSQINADFTGIVNELEDIFGDLSYINGKTYGELLEFNAVVLNLLQNGYSFEDINEQISLCLQLNNSPEALENLAEFCFLK